MEVQYYGQLFNKDQNITPEIRKAVNETIPYGLALIRQNSPVKTGALRAGWEAVPSGQGIEWKNKVKYTIYNELGTVHMAPRAMLTQSMPEINEYFKDRLNRAVGKKYGGEVSRNKETNESRLKDQGRQRASEMTSNRPRFSAPSYEKLTQGKQDQTGGFR
jgi:hypothetical protein